MADNILIMMKDIPVLRVNFDESIYDVLNEKMMPYYLKDRFIDIDKYDIDGSKSSAIRLAKEFRTMSSAVTTFLASRVLPISRTNAKKIYQMYQLEQRQDDVTKLKIALICKAVSLQDNYWVKLENQNLSWSDISIRSNSLSDIVAQVALHGDSLILQGELRTPELTGQGAYAKAWRRESDGLWLYKAGSKDSTESQIEVEVSNILNKTNARHVKYEKRYDRDIMVCACKCITTDDVYILPAMDFLSYCNYHGLDYEDEYKRIDSDMWYKMHIVDYLIANRDRHGMNHGFLVDSNTNEILMAHDLFDHNNSFAPDYMDNPDISYQVLNGNQSMRKAALNAIRKVDFHFTSNITRSDFISQKHYDCFMRRAEELGIETVKESKSVTSSLSALSSLANMK